MTSTMHRRCCGTTLRPSDDSSSGEKTCSCAAVFSDPSMTSFVNGCFFCSSSCPSIETCCRRYHNPHCGCGCDFVCESSSCDAWISTCAFSVHVSTKRRQNVMPRPGSRPFPIASSFPPRPPGFSYVPSPLAFACACHYPRSRRIAAYFGGHAWSSRVRNQLLFQDPTRCVALVLLAFMRRQPRHLIFKLPLLPTMDGWKSLDGAQRSRRGVGGRKFTHGPSAWHLDLFDARAASAPSD